MDRKLEAQKAFEESISKLEKFRRQTAVTELKQTFFRRYLLRYREVVRFMLQNGQKEKAFQYAESAKARVFLDQLAEGRVELSKGIDDALRQERNKLLNELSNCTKQLHLCEAKKKESEKNKLKENFRELSNQFDDLMIKIRSRNPKYASVKYPVPITVQEMQRKFLKPGELLIQYFVTSEELYVFLISTKNFQVVTLDVTEDEISTKVEEYLKTCSPEPFKNKGKYEAEIRRLKRLLINQGKSLYSAVFEPIEAYLENYKNLIIVPDGELAKIPFESLVIGENESGQSIYLLEKYPIKYIQSASVLSVMRKHYKRKSKSTNFIGFGDPVYDYENFKKGLPEQGSRGPENCDEIKDSHQVKYEREGGVMARLQGSGEEVETIATLLSKRSQKNVVYLREEATEKNAEADGMRDFDYIHFSCHGVLGDGFQSLVLSQIPSAKEDGFFTLNEIMNCDYNAKLVVLSACKTGTGIMERGEGVTGLTRAVMYAGTPAVVVSLWNVSDQGTKELMVKFYDNMLFKGMKKEEALRQAKLEMIKGGQYASPYYWSAFVLYGE